MPGLGDAIKAAGGKADYIQLDQPGSWQGSYGGPYGAGYVGPFAGVSHMMMIEDNPAPGKGHGKKGKATNLQVDGRHPGLGGQEHKANQGRRSAKITEKASTIMTVMVMVMVMVTVIIETDSSCIHELTRLRPPPGGRFFFLSEQAASLGRTKLWCDKAGVSL